MRWRGARSKRIRLPRPPGRRLAPCAGLLVLAAAGACAGSAQQPAATPSPLDATARGPDTVCAVTVIAPTPTFVRSSDFLAMDRSLGGVIGQAEAGDLSEAGNTFMGDAHSFTHLIDHSLRRSDSALGEALYNAVADLELGIVEGDEDAQAFLSGARAVRDLLQEAAAALGCGR